MDKFNRLFQKSTENTTCQLYSEMNRLVCLYSTNLLKPDVIQAANDSLSNLNVARRDQLSDESLGVGDATWTHIAQMEEEYDMKPFCTAVRNFYVATIQKIFLNFPSETLFLRIWGLLILNLQALTKGWHL